MFISRLVVEDSPTPRKWKLVAPLIWCDPVFGRIEVPAGFETDLASVPKILQALSRKFDSDGQSRRPAVVHDWFYTSHLVDRKTADKFLRAALIAEGVPSFVAGVYYSGVRMFGSSFWSK